MINKLKEKILTDKYFYIFLSLFILIGIGLRVYVYLQQYSFERDEVAIVLSILEKNTYFELISSPLSCLTIVPYGFLISSKLLMNIFGTNELVFRAIPLLGGIGSIFLFYFFAKKHLSSKSLLLAVLLFSLSPKLIQYSSFFKPYSTDVFISLLLLVFAGYYFNKENINIFIPALLGGISIWFSFPSMFILGAIIIFYGCSYLRKKQKHNFFKFLAISFIWLINSALFFLLLKTIYANKNTFLTAEWANIGGFMPIPFDAEWLLTTLFMMPINLFFMKFSGACITGTLILIGFSIYIFKERKTAVLLSLPVLITLIISSLKLYPFADRHILFLAPIFIVFIAKNFDAINNLKIHVYIRNFLYITFSLIILNHIPFSDKYFLHFRTNDKMASIYEFMEKNIENNDYVYLRPIATSSFRYYANDFSENITIYNGTSFINKSRFHFFLPIEKKAVFFEKDINDLKAEPKRVWFPFYSNVFQSEIKFFKESLDKEATLIKSKVTDKGEVYLYEFF